MKLTTVKEIYKEREKYLDKEVTVGGWVRSVRDSKTFGFIVLHGALQIFQRTQTTQNNGIRMVWCRRERSAWKSELY